MSSPDIYRGSALVSSPSENEKQKRVARAAIAAQACETCRTRKSKCDEQRPKCSLCRRLDVECRYREPVPTKKDKTLQHMMDQLTRMEQKLNDIGMAVNPRSQLYEQASEIPSSSSNSGASMTPIRPSMVQGQIVPQYVPMAAESHLSSVRVSPGSYQHLTAPHKVLLWPAIQEYLQHTGVPAQEDFEALNREGTAWFLKMEPNKNPRTLPVDAALTAQLAGSGEGFPGGQRTVFPELTGEVISRYTDTFFNTYNVFYPLLDREQFERNVLTDVVTGGFGHGDCNSVIALLVFALGKMGYEGVWGQPVEMVDHRASGIRGGTVMRPPGLELFNEARRRLGFLCTQFTIEYVQAFQLTAIYYEACSRHLEFWGSSGSASTAFQVLLKSETIDWNCERGNLIKKVYWTSNLMENWYHLDLDLPKTNIGDYEDSVPLPGEKSQNPVQELLQLQVLAMISLRMLITRTHGTIFEASTSSAETQRDFAGPPTHVIKELLQQLENWRSLLPQALQWRDDNRFGLPSTYSLGHVHHDPLFALEPNTGANHFEYKNAVAMSTAQLRSRYYYAKFMIYRPFVYKVLHFPDQLSEDDRRCASLCLQASLLWPISMDPPKGRKRLVPYPFAWTQNFLGVLLILRMTTENRTLRDIAEKYLEPSELEQTVYLLLDWFRDMQQVDGIAEWAWGILGRVYVDVLSNV